MMYCEIYSGLPDKNAGRLIFDPLMSIALALGEGESKDPPLVLKTFSLYNVIIIICV